jgi:NitT/TauT family transport system ATP-binding protein
VVSFQDVAFAYPNGTRAIDNLSLDVRAGRNLGIVGPSGCGKTTLLTLIARLQQPSAGQVLVNARTTSRHPVSMVFQTDTLLPWLTVTENVKLYFKFHREKKAVIAEWVNRLIRLAGLEGFEEAYPYQLSGGMKRRVAFLAGVAPRPSILLLDEPFSSLDEPTRVTIHQDVYAISRELGITLILVTHDLAEAISLCDDVVILTRRPTSIYSRHVVPFAAERNMLELRQTPEFLELYGTLWQELSTQIGSGDNGIGRASA